MHGACLVLSLHVHWGSSLVIVVLLHNVARVSAWLANRVCWSEVSDRLLSRKFTNVAKRTDRRWLYVGYWLILRNTVDENRYLLGTWVNLWIERTRSSLENSCLTNQLMLWRHSLTQIVTAEKLSHKSGPLLSSFFNEIALMSWFVVWRLGSVNLIAVTFLRLRSLKLIIGTLRHLQVVLTLTHLLSLLNLLLFPLFMLLLWEIAKVEAVLLHLLALVVARPRVC